MYNMRVTANMSSRNYNRSMNKVNSRMDYLYNCILSGQKFVRGSENPKGANRAIFYNTLIEENQTFKDNTTLAKGLMGTADDLITKTISPSIGGESNSGDPSTAVAQILSAINGDKGPDEMRAIAANLEQTAKALIGAINQSYGGRKIFGGLNNSSPPFALTEGANGKPILTYNGVEVDQPKQVKKYHSGVDFDLDAAVAATKTLAPGATLPKTYKLDISYGDPSVTKTVEFKGPTSVKDADGNPKDDDTLKREIMSSFMNAPMGGAASDPTVNKVFSMDSSGKLVSSIPGDFKIETTDADTQADFTIAASETSFYGFHNEGVYLDLSKASTPSDDPYALGPNRTIDINGEKVTFQAAALREPDGRYKTEKELTDENWQRLMDAPLGTTGRKVGDDYKKDNGYLEHKNPTNPPAPLEVTSKDQRATGFTGVKEAKSYEYIFKDANGYNRGIEAGELKNAHELFPGSGAIYLDIGMGLAYSQNGTINPDTALDVSFNGAQVLGCGTTSDGLSKNVIQSLLDAAHTLKTGADSPNIGAVKAEVRGIYDQLVENQKGMLAAHVSVGVRSNAIGYYEAKLEGDSANYKQGLQDAMGLSTMEQAEYITDWKLVNSAYNACLQMGSKVIPPSIFDFIR